MKQKVKCGLKVSRKQPVIGGKDMAMVGHNDGNVSYYVTEITLGTCLVVVR